MSNWQAWLYVAAVLIPLGAFVVQFVGIRVLGRLNAWIATGAIATSCVLSTIGIVCYLAQNSAMFHGQEGAGAAAWSLQTTWVTVGQGMSGNAAPLVIKLGVHIDGLAAMMFLMVSLVATLIHVYSMGYMHDDPGYPRFFSFLSLFCFSMLGLVASATIFMVFVFWELVGICSYLLIGFWYQEKKNCDAGNKAFIVNRVGDIGMLVGLGILWSTLGTFSISEINQGLRDDHGRINITSTPKGDPAVEMRDRETQVPVCDARTGNSVQVPMWLLTIAGLGIFAGCVGKSAQFPLHVWLPDAMAGPTPVSALIHAATMVAAGVYLVGRFFPVFTPGVLLYIAYTGAITLFLAATIACTQTDYKKVLAYSTVSQLGFMMLGLGVGGWSAGLFHLLTHACFKALLFLCAGSVYHAVHTYEMPRLGGLWKKMPVTAWCMLMGTLAISGMPFFSGFYSKGAILTAVIAFVSEPENRAHSLLLVVIVVGATLTAFYMFRMFFLLFAGTSRSAGSAPAEAHGAHDHDHGHGDDPVAHAHESPRVMTWPLIALAAFSVFVGWPWLIVPVLGGTPVVEMLLSSGAPVPLHEHGLGLQLLELGLSLAIATVGIGLAAAFYYYRIFSAEKAARRLGAVYDFFLHKWYFDELYDAVFVRPVLALGRALARGVDLGLIDGIVNGTARAVAAFSRINGAWDLKVVDGIVNGTGRAFYFLGDWGRLLQTGRLRHYLMILALGFVVLLWGLFRWAQAG